MGDGAAWVVPGTAMKRHTAAILDPGSGTPTTLVPQHESYAIRRFARKIVRDTRGPSGASSGPA
jgi:hypothetical protein